MATQGNSWNVPTPGGSTSPTVSRPINSGSEITRLVYSLLVNRVRPILTAANGRWFYQNRSLNPSLIEAALAGEMPLGLVSTSGTGTSRWLCLDSDRHHELSRMLSLAHQLAPTNAVLFEYSRRGAHLFLFHQDTPWQQSRAFGLELARQADLEGVEVYPKSGELNAVRMPGTRHPKDGKIHRPISLTTGQELPLAAVLPFIERYELPPQQMVETPAVSRKTDCTRQFDRLVEALNTITSVRVYAPNRGVALCPWHEDHNPSLLVKGSRFHCARQDCVWGDIRDVEWYVRYGTRPPHH